MASLNLLVAGVISWTIAGIFAVAASHKVSVWPRFCASLAAYRLFPDVLVKPVAAVLTVAEIATVCLLVFLQPLGGVLAALLFFVYLVAIAVNVLRGRTHIDCGCGDTPTPISRSLLMRNAVLIAPCCWLFLGGPAPLSLQLNAQLFNAALAASGWMLAAAIGLSVLWLLCYLSVDQLLTNKGVHRRLWPATEQG